MNALIPSLVVLLIGIAAPCAGTERWRLLSGNEMNKIARISIDENTIRRDGDKAFFRYLVEPPVEYENPLTGRRYRSVVISATVDCRTRTITLGDMASYAEARAGGQIVDRVTASGAEAKPTPIVTGGSDDILWQHVCRVVVPQYTFAEPTDEAISRIKRGQYSTMPSPVQAPAYGAEGKGMTIENGTGYTLKVH